MGDAAMEHDAAPTGAELLTARVRDLVSDIHRLDPDVRVATSGSVHDLRVAVRRLRSTLTSYSPAFDLDVTQPLRDDLRWFGGLLGDVRDPEVQGERLRSLGWPTGKLSEALAHDEASARSVLVTAMDGDRYAGLATRLASFAEHPPLTPVADVGARQLVHARAGRDWQRVQSRISALPAPEHADFAEHLHQVRKSAKRLQYVLEAGQVVSGPDANRLRKHVTKFQQRLGDHHDAALTRRLLEDAGHPPEAAEREAASVVDELPRLWRRVSERARRWLS